MVRKLAVSRLVRGKEAQAVPFRGGFAVVAGVAMFCVRVFSNFPAFFSHRRRSKQKLTKNSYFPVYFLATLYDTLLCATSEPNISSFFNRNSSSDEHLMSFYFEQETDQNLLYPVSKK